MPIQRFARNDFTFKLFLFYSSTLETASVSLGNPSYINRYCRKWGSRGSHPTPERTKMSDYVALENSLRKRKCTWCPFGLMTCSSMMHMTKYKRSTGSCWIEYLSSYRHCFVPQPSIRGDSNAQSNQGAKSDSGCQENILPDLTWNYWVDYLYESLSTSFIKTALNSLHASLKGTQWETFIKFI